MTTTGPKTKSINTATVWLYRRWYCQKPPYPSTGRPPSDFTYSGCQMMSLQGPYPKPTAGNSVAGYNAQTLTTGGTDRARVINRCYAEFRDLVNEKAMTLVNLAERKQAVSMVANSANRMLYAFQLLQRGRRASAMKALGLELKGPWYSRPKDAGRLWLEWHFGWSPLLADIHNSLVILESDWTDQTVRARASIRSSTGSTNNPIGLWQNKVQNRVHCQMQAKVRVTNPNLHRASSLGLINPATIAWELIPFSFLVDWFIPVSAYLDSWTDFVGLSLENAFTTVYVTSVESASIQSKTVPSMWGTYQAQSAGVRRTIGISSPVVRWLPPRQLSVSRAATAVALLLQTLQSAR